MNSGKIVATSLCDVPARSARPAGLQPAAWAIILIVAHLFLCLLVFLFSRCNKERAARRVIGPLRAPSNAQIAARWQKSELRNIDLLRLDKLVARFQRNARRYGSIQAMRSNGAPETVLFCLHYRESDNDFTAHAHNGDPLTHRTRNVPKGRLPAREPPYTFEESAEDAYYVCDRLDLTNWRDARSALDRIERFNGLGYRKRGIPSPYLWSGTDLYARGKYTADGRFDRLAIDRQLGAAAILKRMRARGIQLPF